MTSAQALLVAEGTVVMSKYTTPAYTPLTVSAVWRSKDHRIQRFKTKELGERWLDAAGLELAPAGHRWDRVRRAWVRSSAAPSTGRARS